MKILENAWQAGVNRAPMRLPRVVFARVGWMRCYAGSVPGDERPRGGGKYNLRHVGSEVLNFKPFGERLYGYFETSMQNNRTALERIDPSASGRESLDGVLIVFVAKHPTRGQVIVGWYRNATVYREWQQRPRVKGEFLYRCVARVADCVLLPEPKRTRRIPTGKGAIGQTNVCYPLDDDRTPKDAPWMTGAIEWVNGYEGDNLLTHPIADVEEQIANEVEAALNRARGQGFISSPEQRKALERYAVGKAMRHFANRGYRVEDVGSSRSYDVCCTKNGKQLCVEVKATTTAGDQIVLTAREAALGGRRALFVVHSIKLRGNKATGGVVTVKNPWIVD